MLVVSFFTGAAAAQQWTWATSLALICGFCGFQAEHPLVWQIKQRKNWKPRLLLWASLYGGVAGAISQRLALRDRALAFVAKFPHISSSTYLRYSDRYFNLRSGFSLASATKIKIQ